MDIRKDKDTAALADRLIGAAQELESNARRLKDAAKGIRRDGLAVWDFDPIKNQLEHKSADIKWSAARALRALGTLADDDWLIETDNAVWVRETCENKMVWGEKS